jgi:hypothetical protein
MIGNTECTVAEEELLQGGVVAEDEQGPVDDGPSRQCREGEFAKV